PAESAESDFPAPESWAGRGHHEESHEWRVQPGLAHRFRGHRHDLAARPARVVTWRADSIASLAPSRRRGHVTVNLDDAEGRHLRVRVEVAGRPHRFARSFAWAVVTRR